MQHTKIEVHPLTAVIGAEIHGIDLSQPMSDETYSVVHDALLKHLVVFFRDQELTHDQHVAIGERFGELHIHPSAPCVDNRPELMEIHAAWHTDVSSDIEPPMGSILYLTTVPSAGGDTLFANMYAAYDALSDTMKTMIDPLVALHSTDVYIGRYEQIGGGLRAILKFLYAHCANPQFQCRFRWKPNSVAFWDNRCTQHHATWDYFPETRSGVRVTIKGDQPFH